MLPERLCGKSFPAVAVRQPVAARIGDDAEDGAAGPCHSGVVRAAGEHFETFRHPVLKLLRHILQVVVPVQIRSDFQCLA